MIKTLEQLYVVLAFLTFDYHERRKIDGYGVEQRVLRIFCNKGEEKMFKYLYSRLDPTLRAVYWEELLPNTCRMIDIPLSTSNP